MQTTHTPDTPQLFAGLDEKQGIDEYNFEHFRTINLLNDFKRTIAERGIHPGEIAPDFELPRTDGGTLRLSDLRGKPVLLHFGSIT